MWGDNGGELKDETFGKREHYPKQAHMWGDNGREAETRPRECGHTIQGNTWPSSPSNKRQQEGAQVETKGDKTLENADTPSNTKADTLRKHLKTPTTVTVHCLGKKDKNITGMFIIGCTTFWVNK